MHGAEQVGGLQPLPFDLPEDALAICHLGRFGADGCQLLGLFPFHCHEQVFAVACNIRGAGGSDRCKGGDQQGQERQRQCAGDPESHLRDRRARQGRPQREKAVRVHVISCQKSRE